MTIRTETRDSKIQDDQDVDVLRSPDLKHANVRDGPNAPKFKFCLIFMIFASKTSLNLVIVIYKTCRNWTLLTAISDLKFYRSVNFVWSRFERVF